MRPTPFAKHPPPASLALLGWRTIPARPAIEGIAQLPAKSKPADPAAMVSEDAVRDRAYFLWEADGRPDGRHDHYWGLAIAEATRTLVAMSAAHGDQKKTAAAKSGKAAKAASKPAPAAKSGKPKDEKPAKSAKVKATAKAAEVKPAKKPTKPRAAVPKAK